MKRVISTMLAAVMLLALAACGGSGAQTTPGTRTGEPSSDSTSDTYKIGIVTGTVSQSEDDRRGLPGHVW